jgi:GNAT superfamily N-acetyltransferase
MRGTVSIELLVDHPEVLQELEAWFVREWEPYYGAEGPGDAHADLLECCQRDQMPLAIVAFDAAVVCGTAALRPISVSTHEHFTPWLAAMLVHPDYRGRGVGERLVEAVEGLAREIGFRELYVGTSLPPSGERRGGDPQFYLKRGWALIESGPYFKGDVAILRRSL